MIDINQTRHHLLLGSSDWMPLIGDESGLEWADDSGCVRLKKGIFKFPLRPEDRLTPDALRDAASDSYGHLFWINKTRDAIEHQGSEADSATVYFSRETDTSEPVEVGDTLFRPRAEAPEPEPWEFQGLAVTTQRYLLVGVLGSRPGLLIFDLHGGGPPERVEWPVEFHPFYIGARTNGGALILDWDGSETSTPRVWKLDAWFRLESVEDPSAAPVVSLFSNHDGTRIDEKDSAQSIAETDALDLMGLVNPLGCFESADGDIVTIDAQGLLHLFRNGALVDSFDLAKPIGSATHESPSGFILHSWALGPSDLLYVVGRDGNQAYEFQLGLDDEMRIEASLIAKLYPLRRFTGLALVNRRSEIWYPIEDGRWLRLVEQPRPQYEREGVIVLGPFDGKEPDVVWHRLLVDACIPLDTQVNFEMRLSNRKEDLDGARWTEIPRRQWYRRRNGTELPFESQYSPDSERAGVWETLFQRAKGRYLALRMSFVGSTRSSPRVYALRAYYPRFNYAKTYLPGVYQQDAESASFLERFLANTEGTWTELEAKIAHAQRLFDVDSTPEEYLEWLGSWLGLSLEEDWDDHRRRMFLRHAIELYRQRGTKEGLLRLIRLSTDSCVSERLFTNAINDPTDPYNQFAVRLVETFETRAATASRAHLFDVYVPIEISRDPEAQSLFEERVRRVVQREKPAHTEFNIKPFWALFRIGEARLGYESVLSIGSRYTALVIGQGRLADGYLSASYPYNLSNRNVVGAIGAKRSCEGPSEDGFTC